MNGKRVAIVQSSYVPWKGYFDLIHAVDEFILFDDAQFTRRDWRNRNVIKTAHGPHWLTIPVFSKGRFLDPIKDMTVGDGAWNARHWKIVSATYKRAPFFREYEARFEELYLGATDPRLSAINFRFIEAICDALGITTKLSWSMDYELAEGKTERIVGLCQQAGARTYLSGPSARAYLNADLFAQAGIELVFFDYAGYPPYEQLYPPFVHEVSILDLLFHTGLQAPKYMLTF
jgi:hypothetical protein